MPFTTQEQEIIKYGQQNGKTSAQIQEAISNSRLGIIPVKKVQQEPSLISKIGTDFNQRADKVGEILSRPNTDIVTKGVQALGQGAGGVANAMEQAVMTVPGVKLVLEGVGTGMNWIATSEYSPVKHLGDILGESKTLQEVTNLYDTDPSFKDTIDGVANLARLGMDVQGLVDSVGYAKNVTNKIIENTKNVKAPKIDGLTGNIAKDTIPTLDKFINTEVTKAFDLTQGDVKNIYKSTGNDVGEFVAKHNLIGGNVDDTVKNISTFQKTNYDLVRSEIGKVKRTYVNNFASRYKEALTEIKKQIQDVPGLQEQNKVVDSFLLKKTVTLSDIQKVKELMDEHFSLYKMTGDVKEGVAKKGLANMRADLRKFIETEVKKNTGTDIKELNNNVMTARSINDAIDTRSTRGLTRATISAGDVITFLTGSGFATPVGGALAVIAKKIYQSPSFKLKLTKWLDSVSDAKRLEIKQSLEQGIVPEELQSLPSQSLSQKSINPKNTNATNLSTDVISDTIPQIGLKSNVSDVAKVVKKKIKETPNKQGGFVKNPLADNALMAEAKKYKSAEEFVKAQGETVYHGTGAKFEPQDIKEGVYVTGDKSYADIYQSPGASFLTSSAEQMKNRTSGQRRTIEYVIPKNAKIFDAKNPKDLALLKDYWQTESVSGEFVPTSTGQLDWTEGENVAQYLKNKGYDFDGIKIGEGGGFDPYAKMQVKRSDSIKILNPKILQAKSQLISIWEKANKK